MFVDSKVAVHLFSQEVIALAVLAREVFNQPSRASSKNGFATAIPGSALPANVSAAV
jgi:hypothetical protein